MTAQERILQAASSEVAAFLATIESKQIGPDHAASIGPVVEVLRAYAHAAGVSHLHDAGQAALAEARHLQRMLPLTLAEDKIRSARAALDEQRQTEIASGGTTREAHAEANVANLPRLTQEAADLRRTAVNGGSLDPDQVARLEVEASEMELRARLVTLGTQVRTLLNRASSVGLDEGTHPGGFWSVHQVGAMILGHINGWQVDLDRAKVWTGPRYDASTYQKLSPAQTENLRLRETISRVAGHVHKLGNDLQLDKKAGDKNEDFFTWAYNQVRDQEIRNLLKNIAIQVGVAVITGQVAGMVGATIRGVAAAGEIGAALRGTSLLYRGASLVAQAGFQTGTQAALGADVNAGTFAENALGLVLTSAAMRPFQALLDDSVQVEQQLIRTWREFAKRSGKFAAEMVVDAGAGITGAALARTVVQGGRLDMSNSEEWITNGLSFAANRFVHGRVVKMRERLQNAKQYTDAAKVASLKAKVAALEAETADAKRQPREREALEHLKRRHALLVEELHLMPADSGGRAKLTTAIDAEGAHLAEVTLQLAGLSPVVQGHVYEGSAKQIQRAVEAARAAGVPLEHKDTSRYRVGDREITILGRGSNTSEPHRTDSRGVDPKHVGQPAQTVADRPRGDRSGTADHARGATSDRVVLGGDDTLLHAAAKRAKPKAGYVDVIVHADADSFTVVRTDVDIQLDHRSLATYLRKHGLAGKRIRLVACEAGMTPFAVAQHLSNKLRVQVLAPSMTAWIDGDGTVGVGRLGRHEGRWVEFEPKISARDGSNARMRPPVEPHVEPAPGAPEHVPPLDVRFDHRQRYSAAHHNELQAKLGKRLVVDRGMVDGISVRVERRKGIFGGYEVKEVRVGARALAQDIVAHAELIKLVERYNGALGKVRQLWDRIRGKTSSASSFPHGSRGWVLSKEIEKVAARIEQTSLLRDRGEIDAARANEEVAFLKSSRAYFEAQLAATPRAATDDSFELSRPDTGHSTKRAQDAGYKLPGDAGGEVPGLTVDPDWYYYRENPRDPGTFELARKPTAPATAPQLRARVVADKFVRVEVPPPDSVTRLSDIPAGNELATLFGPDGTMKPYAEMLERTGLATDAVIKGAAMQFHRKQSQTPKATLDDWRHAVKEFFRARVVEKLADRALDDAASYRRMREVVDGLGSSDRGVLVEEWYKARYAPNAKPRSAYEVTRTSGENAGKTETRVTDMVVDGEIREVKDIDGPIDKEQFGAYVDALKDDGLRGSLGAERLRYVFTKTTGAVANLEYLAEQFELPGMDGRLTVEFIDANGERRILTSERQARAALAQLRAR